MKRAERKKILVAMSGGVDSSVAAALLLHEGHEVVGAFMKNWSDTKDELTGVCSWRAERRDAELVAGRLGIPLLTFDFEKEYRTGVLEYFLREYAAGRTPNPDVMCNKLVKFGPFLAEAEKIGADAIATGHYARVVMTRGRARLLAGVDPNKDQSYFLHQLDQSQLRRTLFPVGGLLKTEVRRLAREFRLPTAEKKDSQGICFIGKVELKDFLAARLPSRPGPIVTVDGHVVGRHQGMAPYTIGQRHGLNLGGGEPYFVVDKDAKRNAVIVARGVEHEELYATALIAAEPHWISGRPPCWPPAPWPRSGFTGWRGQARIRYRQSLQEVTVKPGEGGLLTVRFKERQRAVTPGQFVVLYNKEECLGGAVIRCRIQT
ncbi:MAG: tRNA 2-thiouridine(34) synthase MnmA [Patescibacteria group bacterium]|nr:tRNA 2-thiouridine(34) synthase MnmA [Patescibacteria group bacterium]